MDLNIAGLTNQFVLLRLTSLRGVNLDVFEFDYDLTWMAFFLTADERVLGRFGSRTAENADKYRNIEALKFAMEAALKRHRQGPPPGKPPARAPQTVDQYPGFAKFGPKSCVHCHHAYDLRREALQENGTWSLEEVWVYPWPENVGWTLAVTPGNRLDTVAEKSLAAAVGMKTGDLLLEIDGKAVATFTDVQHALHKAPSKGTLPVKWNRDGKSMQATLELAAGWRKTDVSWRQSLKGLEPASGLHGEDLSAAEKKQLGLDPKALAFRQGNFPTPQARQAGILQNDIIVGVNKEKLEMTARQFDAHIRLTYQKGEALTIHLLREGKSVELQMRLKE